MSAGDQTSLGLSQKAQVLLDLIRKVAPSGHVGNMTLRDELASRGIHWTEDEYWQAQTELSDKGHIGTGRGRGGSVWLLQPIEEREEEIPGLVEDEKELYDPLVKWLTDFWGLEAREREDFFLAKKTASPSGRKRESGIWSRPDVSLVEVNKFEYLIIPQVDATSFEVKKYDDAAQIDSIYEAASHARWVNSSWLVAEDSDVKPLKFSRRFMDELERFGVGLITIKKTPNKGWEVVVQEEARYDAPVPSQLNEFLQNFFAEEGGKTDQRNLRRFKNTCHAGF